MFESTLIASRRQKTPRQRLLALPVAVAFHLVALSGFVVAQLVTTPPVSEPILPVAIYISPPPPPMAAKGTPKSDAVTRGPRRLQTAEAPPEVVPETTVEPVKPGEEAPIGDGPGVEGGDPEGREGGIVGGFPFALPVASVTPREEPPIVIGGAVIPPVLLQRIDPTYPETARKARRQGVVILEAIIDTSGNIVDVRVLRDIGLGCGEAALQAIRGWRYQPATLNGRLVSVYLTITVNFQLT
ncbi:MAG: energy transducer TonB [Holophagae bacterium]|nr:energy transducer TonB [Holophagae bacterium]